MDFLVGVASLTSGSTCSSLSFSSLSGLVVQSKKLFDTDKRPASDTEDRRLPEPKGVPSNWMRCEKRFRFRLLKLMGSESRRSVLGVFVMLSKYYR